MPRPAPPFVRTVIPDDFPPVYQDRPELDRLRIDGDVQVFSTRAESRAELLGRLAGAHALINVRSYTKLDAETLAELPDLGIIAVFGAGVDNIDLDAAAGLGIYVTNAPGANARSVAEHALALTLAVARALPRHEREVRAGRWTHFGGVELEGKTFAVLGLGAIGQHAARIAAAFGMRVVAWSPTFDAARARSVGAELVELDDALRQADVLSLHLAVTPGTRGIIGRRELALLKPPAILVNTARGALVDQAALLEALAANRLYGAGLDVYEEEPVPPGHPLTLLDNVVLTPHAGWVTNEARIRTLAVPIDNIRDWRAGRPRNVCNAAQK